MSNRRNRWSVRYLRCLHFYNWFRLHYWTSISLLSVLSNARELLIKRREKVIRKRKNHMLPQGMEDLIIYSNPKLAMGDALVTNIRSYSHPCCADILKIPLRFIVIPASLVPTQFGTSSLVLTIVVAVETHFRPRRWRTFMWKVMVICEIMSSQERLLLYLDLIYRPCHLQKPTNLLTQGKNALFGQYCLQIPLWRQSTWSRADLRLLTNSNSWSLLRWIIFCRFLIEAPFSALAGVVADARDPPKVKCVPWKD